MYKKLHIPLKTSSAPLHIDLKKIHVFLYYHMLSNAMIFICILGDRQPLTAVDDRVYNTSRDIYIFKDTTWDIINKV